MHLEFVASTVKKQNHKKCKKKKNKQTMLKTLIMVCLLIVSISKIIFRRKKISYRNPVSLSGCVFRMVIDCR